MSAQPEALRLADWLQAAVQTYPQMSEDEPGGYATEVDQVMDEAAAELRRLHAENEANERNLCQLTDELAKTVTLLRQALELLEDNREDVARVETTYMHKCYDPVLHAIRHHLGQKGETG